MKESKLEYNLNFYEDFFDSEGRRVKMKSDDKKKEESKEVKEEKPEAEAEAKPEEKK